MLRYRGRDDKPVMRAPAAARSAVVPAKAGTHYPKTEFCEGSLFGTTTIRNR